MALNIDGIEEAIKQSPRRTNVTERGDQDELIDETTDHLNKISDYKSYCKVRKMAELLSYTITIYFILHQYNVYFLIKGLMDIALLTANANQLRNSLELCTPFKYLLVTLFSLSILLQVFATVLLLIERLTCYRKQDYKKCHRYELI